MRFRKICALVCLVLNLVMIRSGMAQNLSMRQYTVDNGLASSDVYHVFQDSRGYIWMATDMGISRFDGHKFVSYDSEEGLPQNTVFEIYEDAIGRVWFISFPFQLSYYQNGAIHLYKYNDVVNKNIRQGLVPLKRNFIVDATGAIWFSLINDNYIYKIDQKGKISHFPETPNDSIYLTIMEREGQLMTSQNMRGRRLYNISVNTKNNKFNIKLLHKVSKYSGAFFIVDQDTSGKVYIAQNEFLYTLHPDGKYSSKEFESRILWMHIQDNENLWIGKEFYGASVYKLDELEGKPFQNYLPGRSVTSVSHDSEGGTWFSTLGAGIFYLPSEAFYSFTSEDGLSGNNIKSVEIFKGKLYASTDDSYSLNVIDKNGVRVVENFGQEMSKIRAISAYKDSILWIGTDILIYSYDGITFNGFPYNHPKFAQDKVKERRARFGIKDLAPKSYNEIMVAQMASLTKIRDRKVIYDSWIDDSFKLRIESVEWISGDEYLLGTFSGLWKYDGKNYEFLGNENPLFEERITDIVLFPDRRYFALATKGSGIVIKTIKGVFQITKTDGLSSNLITSLHLRGDELWVGTNNGLNMLLLSEVLSKSGKPKIHVYRKQHGLISNEINMVRSDDKNIVVATNGGLTTFDPSQFSWKTDPPRIHIENISIMRKDTLIRSPFTLKHNESIVQFQFTGIAFKDADLLKYRYRLWGLNNQWITTTSNEVEFAFLPPGNYRFEVVAVNSLEMVSHSPAIITFTIRPPFWRTWWFSTIVALVIVVILYVIFKAKSRHERWRHALEFETNVNRQQALIKQMDPHFVFNTLNSIQSFIIKNDNMASSLYLSKFSRLMRLILNNSQKPLVKLSDEIDSLNLYLEIECMRFKQKFEYSITCDNSIKPEVTYIPAFVVQPFVENSVWHGMMNLDRQGYIRVRFNRDVDDYDVVTCTVEDNGIGRKKAAKMRSGFLLNKSVGINNVEKRLKLISSLHNKDFSLNFIDVGDNDEVKGTIVKITMPLTESH